MPADRSTTSVAGTLLAAGASTRMGRNKLLLPIAGETIVRRVARRALAVLDPIIVVLGHEAEQIRAALADLPCRTTLNADPARGMHSSVQSGIAALPDSAPAVVVLLGDMPFVTSDMIGTMVDRYRTGDARLVVSRYGDVDAPPRLYDRSLFAELAEAKGCGKEVLQRHRAEAEVLIWPAEALTDLDRPTDYERLGALLATES
jgi:molybdenum cofactor cytidylyltransferase